MKILIFEPFAQPEGHFGTYTAKICQELSIMGHSVTLVTTHLDVSQYLDTAPAFKIIAIKQRSKTGGGGRTETLKSTFRGLALILANLRVLLRLLSVYRKNRFDVVHFFDYELLSTVLLLKLFQVFLRLRLNPLFIVVHAPDPSLQGHKNFLYTLYGKLSRPMRKNLLSNYPKVITAHGTWESGELERLLGLSSSHQAIVSVPYGTEIVLNPPSREDARKKLGIAYNGILLLFFGMLRRDKGIELLIEAMGKVEQECILLLAGMPFDIKEEEVQNLVEVNHCQDRILLHLHYIPDMDIPHYFAAADALILPYRSFYMGAAGPMKTGFGYSKPIIASRVRDLAYHMDAAAIGISMAPDRSDSIKEAIESFLRLPVSTRKEMSENSASLAEGCSWTVVAKHFSDIYNQTLNHKENAF